jgi:hypothetical protein
LVGSLVGKGGVQRGRGWVLLVLLLLLLVVLLLVLLLGGLFGREGGGCLSPSTGLCSPFDVQHILRCNNRTTPGAGPSKAAQKPKKNSKHPWSRPKRGGAGHRTPHRCSPNWSGGTVVGAEGKGVTGLLGGLLGGLFGREGAWVWADLGAEGVWGLCLVVSLVGAWGACGGPGERRGDGVPAPPSNPAPPSTSGRHPKIETPRGTDWLTCTRAAIEN